MPIYPHSAIPLDLFRRRLSHPDNIYLTISSQNATFAPKCLVAETLLYYVILASILTVSLQAAHAEKPLTLKHLNCSVLFTKPASRRQ